MCDGSPVVATGAAPRLWRRHPCPRVGDAEHQGGRIRAAHLFQVQAGGHALHVSPLSDGSLARARALGEECAAFAAQPDRVGAKGPTESTHEDGQLAGGLGMEPVRVDQPAFRTRRLASVQERERVAAMGVAVDEDACLRLAELRANAPRISSSQSAATSVTTASGSAIQRRPASPAANTRRRRASGSAGTRRPYAPGAACREEGESRGLAGMGAEELHIADRESRRLLTRGCGSGSIRMPGFGNVAVRHGVRIPGAGARARRMPARRKRTRLMHAPTARLRPNRAAGGAGFRRAGRPPEHVEPGG